VRLELIKDPDSVVVMGYAHGVSQLFPLPESKSRLLKFTRIPASIPTGKALREWLESHDN